jgi:hypothetical protein
MTASMGELAVEHLHQLGHREIAFIASPVAHSFSLMHHEAGRMDVSRAKQQRVVIGQYEFRLPSSTEVVEVAGYGSTQASPAEPAARQQTSIIQDWHPSTRAFTSAQAKPYLITRQSDPLAYLRCLYLYHWPNPRPGTQLQSITLRTLQPELQATLGVLSVTVYRRGKTGVEP